MIDKLKNCPNCAGILNEAGRCTYCGSKVYDFLSVNFSEREMPSEKTYIRIKSNGKIILAPIQVNTMGITVTNNDLYADSLDGSHYIYRCAPKTEIDLNLRVTGDMIQIDEEVLNDGRL